MGDKSETQMMMEADDDESCKSHVGPAVDSSFSTGCIENKAIQFFPLSSANI